MALQLKVILDDLGRQKGGGAMAESDDLKGLTDLARCVIRDVGRILDATPYGHADRLELRVHFWRKNCWPAKRGTPIPTVRVDRADAESEGCLVDRRSPAGRGLRLDRQALGGHGAPIDRATSGYFLPSPESRFCAMIS